MKKKRLVGCALSLFSILTLTNCKGRNHTTPRVTSNLATMTVWDLKEDYDQLSVELKKILPDQSRIDAFSKSFAKADIEKQKIMVEPGSYYFHVAFHKDGKVLYDSKECKKESEIASQTPPPLKSGKNIVSIYVCKPGNGSDGVKVDPIDDAEIDIVTKVGGDEPAGSGEDISCEERGTCDDDHDFVVKNAKIYDKGKKIYLKGLNWFGFDTKNLEPHGLWTGKTVSQFIKEIKGIGFNALRVPVSPDAVSNKVKLESFLKEVKKEGFYVLIDIHNCKLTDGHFASKPCDNTIPTLKKLAELSKSYSNVIGLDVFNEPYDLNWGEWKSFVESSAKEIHGINPKLLIFAEGIGSKGLNTCANYPAENSSCVQGPFWGENFVEMKRSSLSVRKDKLVLSPHVYGPSVHADHNYFKSADFPGNMPAIWDSHFGFLANDYPMAIGEFGGRYTGDDKKWQDTFVKYLIDENIEHFFYWSLNPNSGDTGGIYKDDWKTFDMKKVELLRPLLSR